jgi:hypothetical protein
MSPDPITTREAGYDEARKPLTRAQQEAIDVIAARPDSVGKHAAFMRCVLGERSYFEIALMSQLVADGPPLDAHTMRYIAERWQA